jgi:hypothetical protein
MPERLSPSAARSRELNCVGFPGGPDVWESGAVETTKRPVKPYPAELRERAVRMVEAHAGDCGSEWATMRSIAENVGCSPETLRL